MSDLIDRQNVLKALCGVCKIHDSDPCQVGDICIFYKTLENVPSAEKTGKWIPFSTLNAMFYCSSCGQWGEEYWHYCPNCGASMNLEKDE